MAFFLFRRGGAARSSAPSPTPCRPLWKLSPFFNVLAMIATAFGVAASLGLGALQINGGLLRVFGMPIGVGWQVGIITVTTVLFLGSALTGVARGIK